MPWRRIDPRFYADHLRRPQIAASSASTAAGATTVWYRDDSQLDQGELVVWLGGDEQVAGFQLSHARWPRGQEHIAEWSAGGPLLVGEVDSGEGGGERGVRQKMSPVIRRLASPDPQILQELAVYFAKQSAVLPPNHRAAIARILDEAIRKPSAK